MYYHPLRLVDNNYPTVFVQYIEGKVFGYKVYGTGAVPG
jgi:hypothetical protein